MTGLLVNKRNIANKNKQQPITHIKGKKKVKSSFAVNAYAVRAKVIQTVITRAIIIRLAL